MNCPDCKGTNVEKTRYGDYKCNDCGAMWNPAYQTGNDPGDEDK